MSLYIIAVGGTGAKFVEAVAHLAAAGLIGEETIRVLFVDPDEANGNLDRARKTLAIYKDCYSYLNRNTKGDPNECPWMKTPIETLNPEVWSPLNGQINRTLASLFNYSNYHQGDPLRNLFDALYTEREQNTQLDMGFRGRPAIGAAVMSQLDLDAGTLDQEPWTSLFNQISNDIGGSGKETRIFLCGSAFGGTGASGFPTLGRLIAERLKDYRSNVKIGGALLLPYFEFTVPAEYSASNEIYARPEQFLLNTEAALRYYRNQAQGTFDTIYLLGNQDLSNVEKFSLGRGDQRNDPHIIELYAALALRHFLDHKPSERGEAVLLSRNEVRSVNWRDLPSDSVKQQLVNTTRFAFAWTTDLIDSLTRARQMTPREYVKVAPWFAEFFHHPGARKDLPDFDQEIDQIQPITDWCESYLRWLGSLHTPNDRGMRVQLFNRDAFIENSGQLSKNSDNFFRLVGEDVQDDRDTIPRLKNSLNNQGSSLIKPPNRGVVGLARAFYVLCHRK